MTDALAVLRRKCGGIHTRENRVPRVQHQVHGRPGRRHERRDILAALHDSAHVVVVHEAHTFSESGLGNGRELATKLRPIVRFEHRTPR